MEAGEEAADAEGLAVLDEDADDDDEALQTA